LGYETWPDETYYQGEYKEGKKHGVGTYKWPDGTIYEGEWDYNSISGNVFLNNYKIIFRIFDLGHYVFS
jgi:hypothetical protein